MDLEFDSVTWRRLVDASCAANGAMREVAVELLRLFLGAADASVTMEERAQAWDQLETLRRRIVQWTEARR